MVRVLRGVFAALVLATMAAGLASLAARADDQHCDREWRDHDRRVHEWRERRDDTPYYYGERVYVSPPVVYGPQPPPAGLNLLFNIR
jgi:hypothetical protein